MAFASAVVMTAASGGTSAAVSQRRPVFVAGASGRVGYRIVRELAAAQVPVRAGCRDVARGREAVGELREGSAPVEYVPFDLQDLTNFAEAAADAEVVVSALGSTEPANLLSHGKVDGLGVAALMRKAAELSSVRTLMIVSSVGVGNPFGFPAAFLNIFGGVLLWKDYSERVARREARETGKDFFIVRPGGMEKAKDDFGETHNVKLFPRGSLTSGVISRQQVAEIVATAVLNPGAARNKTVEAVARTDAPKVELVQLLDRASPDT